MSNTKKYVVLKNFGTWKAGDEVEVTESAGKSLCFRNILEYPEQTKLKQQKQELKTKEEKHAGQKTKSTPVSKASAIKDEAEE